MAGLSQRLNSFDKSQKEFSDSFVSKPRVKYPKVQDANATVVAQQNTNNFTMRPQSAAVGNNHYATQRVAGATG